MLILKQKDTWTCEKEKGEQKEGSTRRKLPGFRAEAMLPRSVLGGLLQLHYTLDSHHPSSRQNELIGHM